MKKPKYGRPGRFSLLAVMCLNALVGSVVFYLVCLLFGINFVVIGQFASHGIYLSERWNVVLPMMPGIGIAMGCLWYWIVLLGRTRGVQWGGAAVYGALIAIFNFPVAAMLLCLLEGIPAEQIPLMMLISLALALLSPAITVGMILGGVIMGLFNARLANAWIAWYKRP